MEKLSRILLYYKEYFVLLLSIILSLSLMFSSESRQVAVLQQSVSMFTENVQSRLMWFTLIFSALEENRKLRQENLRLAYANAQLNQANLENLRLRRMLGFKERVPLAFVPAKVIAHTTYQFTRSIKVDVGAKDGIRKNMAVVTNRGLVGKVITVFPTSVIVQLLTDVNCSVSAKILDERIVGILIWNTGEEWLLQNVAKSFIITPGDTVLTSGYSEIYPANFPIGTVTGISDTKPGLFKEILVQSFVDFNRLEEVFIVIGDASQQQKE